MNLVRRLLVRLLVAILRRMPPIPGDELILFRQDHRGQLWVPLDRRWKPPGRR